HFPHAPVSRPKSAHSAATIVLSQFVARILGCCPPAFPLAELPPAMLACLHFRPWQSQPPGLEFSLGTQKLRSFPAPLGRSFRRASLAIPRRTRFSSPAIDRPQSLRDYSSSHSPPWLVANPLRHGVRVRVLGRPASHRAPRRWTRKSKTEMSRKLR